MTFSGRFPRKFCQFLQVYPFDQYIVGTAQIVDSTVTMTTCACTHLTNFGSGFIVLPNTIDFSYVFAHTGEPRRSRSPTFASVSSDILDA